MLPVLLAQADSVAETAIANFDASAVSNEAAAAVATGAGTAVLGGLIILWIVLALVGLFFFVWWIILLVDLSKRDFPQKSTYMILMILSLFFGFMWLMDLIYYFAIVKNNVGVKKT